MVDDGVKTIYFAGADRVAKIYRRLPEGYSSKLRRMLRFSPPPDGASVAWPKDILYAEDSPDTVVGFVMSRAEGNSVNTYYLPKNRVKYAPHFDYELLLTAAKNIANAIYAIHKRNYVVGYIDESNIFVSSSDASATVIAADTFHPVRESYTFSAGRPEYMPPEMQEVELSIRADKSHDLFGLAVIIYRLLMEGVHPFAGVYTGSSEPPSLESRILAGSFPYYGDSSPYEPPPGSPQWDALPHDLQKLFVQCFGGGSSPPRGRPSAYKWAQTIEKALRSLTTCALNSQHKYFDHLTSGSTLLQ